VEWDCIPAASYYHRRTNWPKYFNQDRSFSMKPSLIVNGAAGRMGKRILAGRRKQEFTIVAALERRITLLADAGLVAGIASSISRWKDAARRR
jgi:hypothetical protein